MNSAFAKDNSMYIRDIGCSELIQARSQQICEAISASLTWQWMGHATIAPGYKPSIEGIRNVYCDLGITKTDLAALSVLKQYNPQRKWVPDWRLEAGAYMLLRIVENSESDGGEPVNSIFNPANPAYILRKPCRGDYERHDRS